MGSAITAAISSDRRRKAGLNIHALEALPTVCPGSGLRDESQFPRHFIVPKEWIRFYYLDRISRINFLSCINHLLINPSLKKTIHLFTVSHDSNSTVKPFFKILLDTDEVEQVRIFKFDDHVDITLVVQ